MMTSNISERSTSEQLARDLWKATHDGDVSKVTALLEQGADPNHELYRSEEWKKRGWSGISPLHRACKISNIDIARLLVVKGGADVHIGAGLYNMTPIHWACWGGSLEVVKYLVEEVHCSVDVRDKDGETPLHTACCLGQKDVVKYLMEECNCDTNVRDDCGRTPLDRALEHVDDDCDGDCVDIALYLFNRGCGDDVEDKVKLLFAACVRGKLDVVKEIVEQHGYDPKDVRDKQGQTPLDRAIEGYYDSDVYYNGCVDVALYLFNRGCGDAEDKVKLLFSACGNLDAVKELVEQHGCDPDVRDEMNRTPLHCACDGGHKDVVVYLVESKCDINVRDNDGRTPLDRALQDPDDDDYLDVALYLINRGCGGDEDKVKLLFAACYWGKLDAVKELVEQHGCDPDVRDEDNRTPLHSACEDGHKDVVVYLVESKCDINVKDDDGHTPLDLATRFGRTEVVDYLKSLQHTTTQPEHGTSTNSTPRQKRSLVRGEGTPPPTKKSKTKNCNSGASQSHISDDEKTTSLPMETSNPEIGTPLSLEDTDALDKLLKDKALDGLSSVTSDVTFERVQQLLREKGLGDMATNLRAKLDEVVGEQQRYLETLENVMTDENTINLRYLKLFLVGPPFVGKTTTLNRLLKVIENLLLAGDKGKIPSTLLANCTQVLAFVKEDEAKWLSSKDLNEEARLLFSYLYETKVDSVDSPVAEQSSPVPPKLARKKRKESIIPKKKKRPHSKPSQHSEASSSTSHAKSSKVKAVIARLQRLIKSGDYAKLFSLLGSTLLNINDVGGQPGFLEMLPALISGPAMYLLFFDLSKELDQVYKIPFSRDDTTITPYDAMHSVEATISQLLSAIASVHCIFREPAPFNIERAEKFSEKFDRFQSVRPVATLIGTHKDQLKGDLKQKNEALRKVTDKFSDIVANPNKETTFFAVDNHGGTEESDLAPIRKHLHKTFNTHFKDANLPVRRAWLIFGIILRKEYHIISMEECLEIGKALNMRGREEVEVCLWYLHHCIGTLMYYPRVPNDDDKWFKNHVICSPQVVFDSISQLIVASLRTLHSESSCIQIDCKDWINRGQFSIESIEKYCTCKQVAGKLENSELIPVNKLVQLLQYTNLLSPIVSSTDNPLSHDTVNYFMPAVLDSASEDELTNPPQTDDDNPAPLLITFDCEFVPTGVFCGLITRLVSRGPRKILGLTWTLESDGVKRNRISFYVDGVHKVTLLSHEKCYEVRVTRNDRNISLHDLCTYVLSSILSVLKDLYERLSPKVAFECPCPRHSQASRDLTNLCCLTECSCLRLVCGRQVISPTQEQQVWIGKNAKLGDHVSLEVTKFAVCCQSGSNLSFQWKKMGTSRPIKTADEPNILEFRSVSEGVYGDYLCDVKKGEKLYFTAYRSLFRDASNEGSSVSIGCKQLQKRKRRLAMNKKFNRKRSRLTLPHQPMSETSPRDLPLSQRPREQATMSQDGLSLSQRSSEQAMESRHSLSLPQRSSEQAMESCHSLSLPQRSSEQAMESRHSLHLSQRSSEQAMESHHSLPLPQRSSEQASLPLSQRSSEQAMESHHSLPLPERSSEQALQQHYPSHIHFPYMHHPPHQHPMAQVNPMACRPGCYNPYYTPAPPYGPPSQTTPYGWQHGYYPMQFSPAQGGQATMPGLNAIVNAPNINLSLQLPNQGQSAGGSPLCLTTGAVCRATADEIARGVGVDPDDLDQPCHDDQLLDISRLVPSWKELAPYLKLSEAETNTIEDTRSSSHALKAKNMLDMWHKKGAFTLETHFRVLVEACLKINNAHLAGEICKLINTN